MSETTRTALTGERGTDFWSAAAAAGSTRAFDPLAWFRSILQYKWPILLATAVATALAIAYTMTATPLYRSTQSLLLDPTRSNIVGVEALVEETRGDDGYVQTQIELLRSRRVAERVLDGLDLLSDPAFVADLSEWSGVETAAPAPGDASDGGQGRAVAATGGRTRAPPAATRALGADFLLSRLSVEPVPTTRLLRIDSLSPDPEMAANVANEFGLQYILDRAEVNRSQIGEVSGRLDTKLEELKNTLESSEQRVLDFRREHGLVDIDGGVTRLTEQGLLQSSTQLIDARLELSSVTDLLNELRTETTPQGLLAKLPALRADPLLQQSRADIDRLRREIESLSNQYGPRHPRIVDRRSELEALQASLARSLRQGVEAVENQRRLLLRKVAMLENGVGADKQAIQDDDAKAVELTALEAEVQTNRDLYYRFFERMIESRSTQGLAPADAIVVEPATPALLPAKPDRTLIVALTGIGTLLVATLVAMLLSGLDDSIKRLSSVPERLDTRLLGVVPLYRRTDRGIARLLSFGTASEGRSGRMFVEAFKSLRTTLLLDRQGADRKVILITSSVPKEGKSMSSLCLARSFAQLERVLLVDADVRRPALARMLGIEPAAPGLSDVLDGTASVHGCIRHHHEGGFDVLTSGSATDRALELLSSARMGELLQGLGRRYDRIVIDCAPIEAVSDALPLSRLADAVIYVVKSHDTSLRLVGRGIDRLRGVNAPLAGVLLTQVDVTKLASYGADQEFHGHYDYYDYATPRPTAAPGAGSPRGRARAAAHRSATT